jgi:hypothetical protein
VLQNAAKFGRVGMVDFEEAKKNSGPQAVAFFIGVIN